jgi:tetratricopeptide (TPR) repeat protein
MMKKPAKKSPARKKSAPNAQIAAAMRQMEKLMASRDLITQNDLNALLASLHGPSALVGLSDAEADARDEAQQLAFDAMEAQTEAQAVKLAKRALRLDPDCVDALVVLGGIESDSPRKMIESLQNAVAAGERSLGAQFIRENKGHFWMLMETRPYMRALEQLASLLCAEGFKLDAIKHYEKILALNPNDNQGVRDPLLGLYLATDNLEGARKLLKDYEEDSMANFAWGRVLERFLSADLPGAAEALKIARKQNRFVELYLSGQKGIPREIPEMYSMGSDEEAVLVLENMSLAWAEHKEALFWLLEQLMKDVPAKKSPGAKLKVAPSKPAKKRNH